MEITGNRIDLDSYLQIDKGRISKRIGYSDDAHISGRIESLIEEYADKARFLVEPVYTYTTLDITKIDSNRVFLDNSVILESHIISQVLQHCNKVAIFALTIGNRLENMTAQLGEKGLILEAFVLDTIGSSYTEETADLIHGVIGEMANIRNLSVSRRISPGYCDWDIGQQQKLFDILSENLTSITLSEDFMMTPEKSIMGIIGIGPKNSGIASYNPCSTCTKYACIWRKE